MPGNRMRQQNGGDDTEDDREGGLGREIALLARFQQRVFGISRVDMDVNTSADRISRDLPAREHACRLRQAADPDVASFKSSETCAGG